MLSDYVMNFQDIDKRQKAFFVLQITWEDIFDKNYKKEIAIQCRVVPGHALQSLPPAWLFLISHDLQ